MDPEQVYFTMDKVELFDKNVEWMTNCGLCKTLEYPLLDFSNGGVCCDHCQQQREESNDRVEETTSIGKKYCNKVPHIAEPSFR